MDFVRRRLRLPRLAFNGSVPIKPRLGCKKLYDVVLGRRHNRVPRLQYVKQAKTSEHGFADTAEPEALDVIKLF